MKCPHNPTRNTHPVTWRCYASWVLLKLMEWVERDV